MPTIALSKLADGTFANSVTAVYTAPSRTANYTTNPVALIMFNTSATTQTVDLYYTPDGGSDAQFARIVLLENERAIVDADSIPKLSESDALKAQSTTASVVNYFLAAEF